MTQASRLIESIRTIRARTGRWPTYGDLLLLGISTAPHKRLSEPSARASLRPGERIEREKNAQGLVVFKIVRAK